MYAQYNNPLPVWIICHKLTNLYLHQFSAIPVGIVSIPQCITLCTVTPQHPLAHCYVVVTCDRQNLLDTLVLLILLDASMSLLDGLDLVESCLIPTVVQNHNAHIAVIPGTVGHHIVGGNPGTDRSRHLGGSHVCFLVCCVQIVTKSK